MRGLLEQERAAADVLPLPHHIEIDRGEGSRDRLGTELRLPGIRAGELGHPQEADRAAIASQRARLRQGMDHTRALEHGDRPRGVVVRARQRMAEMAGDEDLARHVPGDRRGDERHDGIEALAVEVDLDLE